MGSMYVWWVISKSGLTQTEERLYFVVNLNILSFYNFLTAEGNDAKKTVAAACLYARWNFCSNINSTKNIVTEFEVLLNSPALSVPYEIYTFPLISCTLSVEPIGIAVECYIYSKRCVFRCSVFYFAPHIEKKFNSSIFELNVHSTSGDVSSVILGSEAAHTLMSIILLPRKFTALAYPIHRPGKLV